MQPIVVAQAGQFACGSRFIAVIETAEDDGGRWAVFGYQTAGGQFAEVAVEEGEAVEIADAGRIRLLAVRPTRVDAGPGAVALRVEPRR